MCTQTHTHICCRTHEIARALSVFRLLLPDYPKLSDHLTAFYDRARNIVVFNAIASTTRVCAPFSFSRASVSWLAEWLNMLYARIVFDFNEARRLTD